ncbi:polysaccharide biosynthesis tyrosine autokinase [Marixanthomonas ophiurae]|uniref:non-specific protein-tyrosine kinase n=1 Tax=Marixanthomonas ophiurae TaxID=387659 RepID=A0A3E1QD05_9FLAO|nr:polysaccharide biosynthesis tyrosine autokinase [Marixanthomonas ophiurae]RFN60028.1 polysaccharide biosynthesis tyrosine autokinase [Marixanthomonas ophiurae]
MSEEFDIKEISASFDIKSLLLKILAYWPLFLISLAIGFTIAYYINVRKLPVYSMDTLISIKDDQNPFFTSNTSLTFNWGGTTDKVNTAIINLTSRSHNEKVVERLQYYMDYLKDGEYQQVNAYKKTPFLVEVDTSGVQIVGKQFKIVFKDSVTYTLSSVFEGNSESLQNYHTKEKTTQFIEAQKFSREYKLGEKVKLPFLRVTLVPFEEVEVVPGVPYYISFYNFDGIVGRYSKVDVSPESRGGSVLKLLLSGANKAQLVDYLNASVAVLSEDMLERKNLFATKTIRFIDSSLTEKSRELGNVEDELNAFRSKNEIFNLETEGQEISAKLNALDLRKEDIERETNYYNTLEDYLVNRTDYRNVPAPSVAGIQEGSIIGGVGRIVSLAEERNKLQYSYREGAPVFADIDRRIDAVKRVLLENIRSSKELKNQELSSINSNIGQYESEIRGLPKEQQELLKIQRRYNLSEGTYNLFLSKRSEAGLVKAANVSDVLVIDSAKDTGGGQIGPNTQMNYIIALLLGILIPLMFIILRMFFSTKVTTIKDVEQNTKIPILGVIGKSYLENNLAVVTKPKSAVAEGFRALRSSLQFMYKKQGVTGAKTVLVTSSVSGEGKTFTSINIASVFALSEKKTVLLGLDLRRPKIFDDFEINNKVGVVNYLIEDASIDEIIQKTKVGHLDVITSGPVPPNPSELLMGENMSRLIDELKEQYDYIILDTPPLGLVADALELLKYADATIYMVRQNYTKKGMFDIVNEKYRTGEITNISIVMNFFEEKAKYGYGYGYGYGGYGYGKYGNGYHQNAKKPSLLTRIKNIFKR